MASDRQQFDRCWEHWQDLQAADERSYTAKEGGIITIVVSDFKFHSNIGARRPNRQDKAEFANFSREARQLRREFVKHGFAADIVEGAAQSDMIEVIQDRRVRTIYTIGHGSLSGMYLSSKTGNNFFSWKDAAKATTHLKTGHFVQRQCGEIYRNLPVPLGMFVVDKFRSVHAPLGEQFKPKNLHDDENDKIRPVFENFPHISYEAIKQYFHGDQDEEFLEDGEF